MGNVYLGERALIVRLWPVAASCCMDSPTWAVFVPNHQFSASLVLTGGSDSGERSTSSNPSVFASTRSRISVMSPGTVFSTENLF